MNATKPLKRIALVLLVVVLLPALIFTAREFSSLNEKEQLISEIYRQQLEIVLFSLNQYAWDATSDWVSRLNSIYPATGDEQLPQLWKFLAETPAIEAVFFSDSLGGNLRGYTAPGQPVLSPHLSAALQSRPDIFRRLRQYQKSGYRKIEPLPPGTADGNSPSTVWLLFPLTSAADPHTRFGGMALEPEAFIRGVLFPKLREMAGERFQIAVIHGKKQFSYDPSVRLNPAGISEQKEIWLFPAYFLAIRPRGGTIEEVATSRFRQNMLLIFILTTLIIGAVWFVYRSVRREMQLAQLKSDFVSNISHELRTPLALIRMFAETLSMGRVTSEAQRREYYQIIEQESERLTHLINNILNFSRIEAGHKAYQFQQVMLDAMVEEVLNRYRFHLQHHGFQVETELARKIPAVRADPEAVTEALLNLIDNSIKYSEEERWIRIRTGQRGGEVFLEVQDRGIGITAADQDKIFEKFHRISPAGAGSSALGHNTKGSGLGLTLVKYIMEAHGGRVQVESKPGQGATFRLIFPGSDFADRKTDAAPGETNGKRNQGDEHGPNFNRGR